MATNFEQSMAALAENRISAEHSNLVPYRQGFVLLDFDEETNKAFGIYRFVIGNIPCMMPVVIRDGEVDGLDILIVRDIKLFVPAVDGWIAMISSLGSRDIGELLPKKDKTAKGASQVQIRMQDFPYMLKTAAAELSTAEFSALMEGLVPPQYEKMASALSLDPVSRFIPTSASASYLVAKSASDADFHDRFVTVFGQPVLDKARMKASALVQDSVLKRSEPDRGELVHVITDIGDAQAQTLTANQKRVLMRTGQFIVDKRAESETATVYASPESLCLRTNPTPGRWDVLANDGRLVPCEVAYAGTDVPPGFPNPGMNVGLGTKKNQQVEFVLVPLYGKGFMNIEEGRQIFCRPSKVDDKEWEGKGKPATTETVAELVKARKTEDAKTGALVRTRQWVSFLVVAGGRAIELGVDVDIDNPKSMTSGGVPVQFSDRFRTVKSNEHCIYVPATARIYDIDSKNERAFVPGTPSDLDYRVKQETGAKDLKINLRGQLVQIDGAVTHAALSENDAVRALVFEAGIAAPQAYAMVRKAATTPDKEIKYLWKQASPDVGPIDISTVHNEPATTTYTPADVNRLNEATPKVVGTAKAKTPDDVFTKDMLQSILQMTDFREISADTLQALSAAMNEAGRLLLRILVHRDEYEERYGEDDTERLQTTCQKQFTGNGDMVLFLREKRGASGQSDNESLMDLLSADMG